MCQINYLVFFPNFPVALLTLIWGNVSLRHVQISFIKLVCQGAKVVTIFWQALRQSVNLAGKRCLFLNFRLEVFQWCFLVKDNSSESMAVYQDSRWISGGEGCVKGSACDSIWSLGSEFRTLEFNQSLKWDRITTIEVDFQKFGNPTNVESV